MSGGVMMQYFHWHAPADGSLWNELADRGRSLRDAGFSALWIPPAFKGSGGPRDPGYGCYDLFDLGEFDQKGSVRTKYGTKAELLNAIRQAQGAGLQVYADVVFNHKDGGDETEEVWGQEVDWQRRNETRSDWYPFDAWTKFTFPGRRGRYSAMTWHWWCFDALSYNADTKSAARMYRLKNRPFETGVSHEHGNYDYLLANDLDMGVPEVCGELTYWGEWFLEQTGVDGFRLDACKHIRRSWFPEWLAHLRGKFGQELFSVGEYWSPHLPELREYLHYTHGAMSLFDVPLHYRLNLASHRGSSFDLRTILDDTLVKEDPVHAVTFVDNHDTQPFESLYSPVEPWFKPHAYALILLRGQGYPCVFYADYYGARYPNPKGGEDVSLPSHRFLIDCFLKARRDYGFGDQHDYFDHPNTIGWVRTGNAEHPGAMAVLMSNGHAGHKWMQTCRPHASFRDATGHLPQTVRASSHGWAQFHCPAGNVSVWLQT